MRIHKMLKFQVQTIEFVQAYPLNMDVGFQRSQVAIPVQRERAVTYTAIPQQDWHHIDLAMVMMILIPLLTQAGSHVIATSLGVRVFPAQQGHRPLTQAYDSAVSGFSKLY